MRASVLLFPGLNRENDAMRALQQAGGVKPTLVWHAEHDLPSGTDIVVVPGGFSYGDYLRTGAIARFRPIMQAVQNFAAQGGPVLGICNGFQILTEAGLLPGALVRNRSLQFRCEHVFLKTENNKTPFTQTIPADKLLRVPIAHGEGCYFADTETLAKLNVNGQVLWRYVDAQGKQTEIANPNGSLENIAGICNEQRNVAGLMPHPERASEGLLGSADGRLIFESLVKWLQAKHAQKAA